MRGRGEPNYDRMTSEWRVHAAAASFNQAILNRLGALRAMSFRADEHGNDIYMAISPTHRRNGGSLAQGRTIGRIALGAVGRIDNFRVPTDVRRCAHSGLMSDVA